MSLKSVRNCTCQEQVCTKMLHNLQTYVTCELQEVDLLSGRTLSNVHLSAKDKKKVKKMFIGHAYCPWCGKAYQKG